MSDMICTIQEIDVSKKYLIHFDPPLREDEAKGIDMAFNRWVKSDETFMVIYNTKLVKKDNDGRV